MGAKPCRGRLARDPDAVWTIGRRLRSERLARGKSWRVIAGLAGMSKNKLWRIERGECALDRLSDIVALARAMSGLTRSPGSVGTRPQEHHGRPYSGEQPPHSIRSSTISAQ